MWEESIALGARTLTLQTGKIAKQAHGAVLVKDGKTVILSTVVYDAAQSGGAGFFPLTVDFRSYYAAAGRIPGSFQRREGRGGDPEILASRLCDRSLRPLFPEGFQAETQVQSTVLSFDPASDAPVLSIIAAAAALHLSEIPWRGPLAAARIAHAGKELVLFPTPDQRAASDLDLVLSLSREGVVMMEGGARQVPEGDVMAAIAFAQARLEPLLDRIEAMRKERGKPKAAVILPQPPAFEAEWVASAEPALKAALAVPEKSARRAALAATQKELEEQIGGISERRNAIEQRLYAATSSSGRDLQAMSDEVRHLTERRADLEELELVAMLDQDRVDAELRALGAAWREVASGSGAVVAIEGEAGVGKSRLAYEFMKTSRP